MSPPLAIQIVSFDWPWPPTYGGVIDVFYRVDSLLAEGVAIDLHVVAAAEPPAEPPPHWQSPLLRVFGYARRGRASALGRRPYIVASRDVPRLLPSLAAGAPAILYEGVHTTATLAHPRLGGHDQWVRVHNVEADYYAGLARSPAPLLDRVYFAVEARRLRGYERRVLAQADLLIPISRRDAPWCETLAPGRVLVQAGYASPEVVESRTGRGTYVLYHAGLHVADNADAAREVAGRVRDLADVELVVAGRSPSAALRDELASLPNVRLEADPSVERMHALISDAHVVLLESRHSAGFKLKLLESLARGRFVLANRHIVDGAPGLRRGVVVRDDGHSWREALGELMRRDFTAEDLAERRALLSGSLRGELVQTLLDKLHEVTFRTN